MSDALSVKSQLYSFAGVAIPIFAVNSSGIVIGWNRSMEQASGISNSEIYHRCMSEFLCDSSSWDTAQKNITQHTKNANSYNEEYCTIQLRDLSLNRTVRTFRVRVVANTSDDGQLVGTSCFADLQANSQKAMDISIRDDCLSPTTSLEVSPPISEKVRAFIDLAYFPVFGIDENGCISEWNDKMVEITCHERHEVLAKSIINDLSVHPFQMRFQDAISAVAQGRQYFEMDVNINEGQHRRLMFTFTGRRRSRENDNDVLFIAYDIPPRMKNPRTAGSYSYEIRRLIENTGNTNTAMFGVDTNGKIDFWNCGMVEVTGITSEDAISRSFVNDFVSPQTNLVVQEIMETCSKGQTTTNFEFELISKVGGLKHVVAGIRARCDDRNNIDGVRGIVQDVTETFTHDQNLSDISLQLKQLVDTRNAPIFGVDRERKVTKWNRFMEDVTGFTKEETIGFLLEPFLAPSTRLQAMSLLELALLGNDTSNEIEFVSKIGETIRMNVQAIARRNHEGLVTGVVVMAKDRKRNRANSEVIQTWKYIDGKEEAKSETEQKLTAYFAHELRNPLSALDSALNAAIDAHPSEMKTLVSEMQGCIKMMTAIMNNLIDIRKLEEGKISLKYAPLSLQVLVMEVQTILLPSVKPGVTFQVFYDTKGRDWVIGDVKRLLQILVNVVANSIKFTIAGKVELAVGWNGDHVAFQCVDTGPGTAMNSDQEDAQLHLFKSGAPCTGLDLTVTKHLVKLAKGSILFEKNESGNVCNISLPLSLSEFTDSKIPAPDAQLIDRPLRFLIVDDVKINRVMLKRRLQKNICPQCTVFEASTGEEAVQICGKDKFDVIVVDQYMEEAGGVMFGTDAIYCLRRIGVNSVIIGCSGNDLEDEFMDAGVDLVWQKPIPTNEEIISQLHHALEAKAKS